MKSFSPTEYSRQRVGHSEIVIVMCMKVKVGIRIALDHLPEVLDTLQGIHNTKRIGQHKPADTDVAKRIHQIIDIRRRILHAVRPVFKIEVHSESLTTGIFYFAAPPSTNPSTSTRSAFSIFSA